MPSATSAPSSRPQTPTAARAGVLSGLDSVLNESSHDGYFGEATTSKVTLDELKRRKLQVLEKRKELLIKAHEHNLRELSYLLYREDRYDLDGSPAVPPPDDQFELTDEENKKLRSLIDTYGLGHGKSIALLGIPTLDEAREAILRDIARNRKLNLPIRPRPDLSTPASRTENRSMPPPATTPVKGEAIERQRKGMLTSSKSSTNVLPKLPVPTEPQPLASAPPAQSIVQPTLPQVLPIVSQLTQPLVQSQLQSLPFSQSQSSQSDSQQSQTDSQTGSQSTLLTVPPSQSSQTARTPTLLPLPTSTSGPPPSQPVAVAISESPLHPTLQILSPNPLSVTYASSLRPLPPDPFRRFTGVGVGGGAIHHRGHRKAPQLPSKNGAPPPAGPAGAGGVDLFKWAVRARASPGAGLVGKADKCLLTNDWRVAFTEQRFIRTMNRIEKLKSEGLWSFRQPKKQKGPIVRKAHWDHLLEEMRWMQTDFREERRWKTALAYQLALAAREFVRAKTPQARARLTVKTRPIRHLDGKVMEVDDKADEVEASLNKRKDEDREEEEEEAAAKEGEEDVGGADDVDMADTELVGTSTEGNEVPAQDADAELTDDADADADMDADADADADADGEEDAPGEEDVDAEGEDDDGEVEAATGLLVEGDKPLPQVEVIHEERPAAHMPALSTDVSVQASASQSAEVETGQGIKVEAVNKDVTLSQELPMNLLANVRAPIFSMDVAATSVSPVTLLEHTDSNALAEILGISSQELGERITLEQLSISSLFPELPLFDGPSAPSESGKGERRWDDGSLNQLPRLTHVSRLMDSKPLLVSTLQPAKNRVHDRWREDGEWKIAAELADPSKGVPPEILDMQPAPGSVLFTRKSNKPSRDATHVSSAIPLPVAPSNAEIRASQFLWTSEEDDYLLSLIKQYGQHWQLIADLFNATRLSVPTDYREAWDCYDRYQRIQQAAAEGKPPPVPAFLTEKADGAGADGKTNGSSGPLSNSLALKREKLTKKVGLKYDGSRKKLRRVNITEVMKKCAKRRAETQQRNVNHPKQVNLQSHETHNQIKIGITPSPQQLSMLKAERDEANARQFALIQQQHRQAQAQAAQAQAQAQAAAAAAAAAQQQAQGQSQAQTQVAASAPSGQHQLASQQQQQQQLHVQQQRLLQQLQAQQQQARPQMPQQQQRFPAEQGGQQQHQQSGQAVNYAVPASSQPVARQAGMQAGTAGAAGRIPVSAARPPTATPATSVAPGSQIAGTPSIPPQLAALQATLTQSLANNPNFTPEQINTIALQLYRQAQQQGGLSNINLSGGSNNGQARPAQPQQQNLAQPQQQGRPVQPAQQQQQQQPQQQQQQQQKQLQKQQQQQAQQANKGGVRQQQQGKAGNVRPPSPQKQASGANNSSANPAAVAAAVAAASAANQKAKANASSSANKAGQAGQANVGSSGKK